MLFRLYYSLFNKDERTLRGQKQVDLQDIIDTYDKELGSKYDEHFIRIDSSDDEIAIAVCTPLMKRVHCHISQSGQVVYIDTCVRKTVSVFLLLTDSAAGGLPLGVLIVSSDKRAALEKALLLYNSLLDTMCFGDKGISGLDIK